MTALHAPRIQVCGADDTCVASSCTDKIMNGDEEGVDCGPSCFNTCLDAAASKKPVIAPAYVPQLQQYQRPSEKGGLEGKTNDRSNADATLDEEAALNEQGSPLSWLIITLMVIVVVSASSYLGYNYYQKAHRKMPTMPTPQPRPQAPRRPLPRSKLLKGRDEIAKAFAKKPEPVKKIAPAQEVKKKATPKSEEMKDLENMLKPKETRKKTQKKEEKKEDDFVDLEDIKKKKGKKKGDDVFDEL